MASNFARSKTMPFCVAQDSTLVNVSFIWQRLSLLFAPLTLEDRPSSTYPPIFIPAFLSFFVSILNRRAVNKIKKNRGYRGPL